MVACIVKRRTADPDSKTVPSASIRLGTDFHKRSIPRRGVQIDPRTNSGVASSEAKGGIHENIIIHGVKTSGRSLERDIAATGSQGQGARAVEGA